MTRVLSELLGAKEPGFRLGLRQMEQASGEPREDIRLSTEVMRELRGKLHALGMDGRDTTGQELYNALLQRVREDNRAFMDILGTDSDSPNLMPSIERLIRSLKLPRQVFALKGTVAKKLLRKIPPKKAMKQLGYRSLESLLKHEAPALILAAARIAEAPQWHKSMRTAYKKLLPSDFEVRNAAILAPASDRWETLSETHVRKHKQNVMLFRELGAVVLLPLGAQIVEGAPLATMLLTLKAMNDLQVISTYLKLHQVQGDFGSVVAEVVRAEPSTKAVMAGMPLPWKVVHRYYARYPEAYSADIFEPHVQADDLQWQAAEDALAQLHPRFEFWRGGAHVGLLHDGKPVSLNFLDAVLNFCNTLPYEQRIVKYLREHLWHELMLRYMHQHNLKQAVHDQLGSELVDQAALV